MCSGVSRRSWQIQIVQDDLEEAAETFEVLLASPEGAVIGAVGKAQVTIGRSGSRTRGRDASGPPSQARSAEESLLASPLMGTICLSQGAAC